MNELIFEKLEEFYNCLDNDEQIKEIKSLKEKIYSDNNLRVMLDKYRNTTNKYDSEFISLKKEIINNPSILRYRELENELYFITLEINKKLNTLIGKKECNNENN